MLDICVEDKIWDSGNLGMSLFVSASWIETERKKKRIENWCQGRLLKHLVVVCHCVQFCTFGLGP